MSVLSSQEKFSDDTQRHDLFNFFLKNLQERERDFPIFIHIYTNIKKKYAR